jgi:hypothetical protein
MLDSLNSLLTTSPWILPLILAWSLPWKGVALWRAARNRHLAWFVAIFIVNTLAILEIIYIFAFSRRKPDVGPTA